MTTQPLDVTRREPIVHVVDDDPTLLRSLARLLTAAGFRVETYDSARAFLTRVGDSAGCAVLDLHMPGPGGLELQEAISRSENPIPVIFLTGRGDVPSSVRAMKGGAVDFLTKPASGEVLIKAVQRAITLDKTARTERCALNQLRARYNSLTVRERQVFALVAQGLLNKQIAAELGTSERTIKAHRANVMRKMESKSVADLARAAERLHDVIASGSAGD